ncbi:hypothetical protein HDU67_001235, partial [Dinochytrium kinnereticum]
KGQYHISLSKLRVYDTTELGKYCSPTCLALSRYFRGQLLEEPAYLRDFNMLPKFEVIPSNISPSDVKNMTSAYADTMTREQLLAEYVRSLLERLPHVSGVQIKERTAGLEDMVKKITIRENNETNTAAPTPIDPPSDPFAVEGFIIRPRKSSESSAPTTEVIPEFTTNRPGRVDSNATIVPVAEVNQGSRSGPAEGNKKNGVKEKITKRKSVTWKEPLEMPKSSTPVSSNDHKSNLRPPTAITGPSISNRTEPEPLASPQKPITPKTIIAELNHFRTNLRSSNPNGSTPKVQPNEMDWLRPSKNAPKPTLSLFGRVWTFLDNAVTDETREFVRTGLSPDPLAIAERMLGLGADFETEVQRRDIFCQVILKCVNLLKRAFAIATPLSDDIIALIGTFQLKTTGIVPSTLEERVITVIILRVLRKTIPQLDAELKDTSDWEQLVDGCGITLVEVDVVARIFFQAS